MKVFCPYCGQVVEPGHRCPAKPRAKRKPTKGDQTRQQREPWRGNYWTNEYRDARQQAIQRTHGRCTDCGKVCARWDGSRWLTADMGGEVDHVRALSEGGTNSPENLALRCKSCHKLRDDARRAKRRG